MVKTFDEENEGALTGNQFKILATISLGMLQMLIVSLGGKWKLKRIRRNHIYA